MPIVLFEGCCLTGQLVLTSEDGTVRRQLLDLPQAFVQYPRWSPNGRQIVFHRQASDPHGPGGVFIIDVDGSGLREISPPSGGLAGADWSPDGTRLVAYSGNGIAAIAQDGSGFTPLPPRNAYPYGGRGISWSPDGNEILYNGTHDVAGFPGGPDVWVFNIATGVSRMLATPGLDARWSPDGRRVAFIATDGLGVPGSLILINTDGSNPRTLVPAGSAGSSWPEFAWSPDGQRILYAGERFPCGCSELYTISVDGGESTNTTNNAPGKYARYPDWHRRRPA